MAVFVEPNSYWSYVARDFAHIVTDYGYLGHSDVYPEMATYDQHVNTFANDRINDLVNNFPQYTVRIFGCNGNTTLPSGRPITARAGETYVDRDYVNAAGTGLEDSVEISIMYDVTGGPSGKGYCNFGPDGKGVLFPSEAILFHELSHVYHWFNNDYDRAAEEVQARTDENRFRTEHIPPIPIRDVNNDTGGEIGKGVCDPSSARGLRPMPKPRCLIVAAAYGSPYARQVRALQSLRDGFLRRSRAGDHFLTALLNDYYCVSPFVAADMARIPLLSRAVREVAVEPLVGYFRLFEKYVRWAWRFPSVFAIETETELSTCYDLLRRHGWEVDDIYSVQKALVDLVSSRSWKIGSTDPQRALSCKAAVVKYLGSHLRPDVYPRIRWALLRPLVIYWTALNALARREVDPADVSTRYRAELENWLASWPLDFVPAPDEPEQLHDDLILLRATVYTSPGLRDRFALQLLRTERESRRRRQYQLRDILTVTGFIDAS